MDKTKSTFGSIELKEIEALLLVLQWFRGGYKKEKGGGGGGE